MAQPIRFASLIVFLAFPILEIGLLIRVGQTLGFWRVAMIVVATAILGTAVIRRTGLAVLGKARAQMEAGGTGVSPLFDGLMQLTAGMLLIFPGLISDVIGLVLLIPPIRLFVITTLLPKIFAVPDFGIHRGDDPFKQRGPQRGQSQSANPFDPATAEGVTIEGEYERLSEKKIDPQKSLKPRPAQRSAK
jgi:UPF0716 protein FxsA